MQAQFINLPQGQQQPQGKSPLDTLQQLMMMKQAYDQEEKQRQARFKDQLKRMQMEYKWQKDLVDYKNKQGAVNQQNKLAEMDYKQKLAIAQFEKQTQITADMENEKYQQQMQRSMGALGGLEQAYTDQNAMGPFQSGRQPLTQRGQEIMPAARFYTQAGQDVPSSIFTTGRVNPNEQRRLDLREKGLGLQAQAEQRRQQQLTLDMQKLDLRTQDMLNKMEDKDRNSILNLAKTISSGKNELFSDQHVIGAIKFLATLSPKFRESLNLIETEKGWFGSKKEVLKQPGQNTDSLGIR